jgi:hypothetical protein
MSNDVSPDTLALVRQALSKAMAPGELAKASTFSQPTGATTGLQTYNLEAPAKNLVPFLSPLRNKIPRIKVTGGIQANWKAVTSVDTNQMYSGISEGRRGGQINVNSADYYAAFRTLGRESSVTIEAGLAAEGFDDLYARAVTSLLKSTMQEEEKVILGANATHPLGASPVPVLAAATTGGTIGASAVVSVIVVGLSYDAYRRASINTTSIVQQYSRANQDGTTETINAGTCIPSAAVNVTVSAGTTNSVVATVTPGRGMYGYAWFAGPVGSERFYAVTSASKVTITLPSTTNQLASTLVAADYSNDTLIHDGLLGIIGNPAYNSYYKAVVGGATLTPDGAGGIVEFDDALQYFYDVLRLVPTRILVGSQEVRTIKHIITQAGSAVSLGRFNFTMNQGQIVGGAMARGYLNCFGDQREIPIEQHPFMVNGTVLFLTDELPYEMNNVSNVMQILTRQDYWQNEWPMITRARQFGVYTDQVLQHYFPPSMGIITNLSAG